MHFASEQETHNTNSHCILYTKKAHDHAQCTWRIFQTKRDSKRESEREKVEEVWKLNQGNECLVSNVHYATVMKITQ